MEHPGSGLKDEVLIFRATSSGSLGMLQCCGMLCLGPVNLIADFAFGVAAIRWWLLQGDSTPDVPRTNYVRCGTCIQDPGGSVRRFVQLEPPSSYDKSGPWTRVTQVPIPFLEFSGPERLNKRWKSPPMRCQNNSPQASKQVPEPRATTRHFCSVFGLKAPAPKHLVLSMCPYCKSFCYVCLCRFAVACLVQPGYIHPDYELKSHALCMMFLRSISPYVTCPGSFLRSTDRKEKRSEQKRREVGIRQRNGTDS